MIIENKNWRKRLLSLMLCFVMIVTMVPMAPIHAHAAEAGTEGVVEVTEPLSDVTEETTEPSIGATESTTESAPVCDCGTDDAAIHATTCAVYVAPENPVCYCAEKCTEDNINVWCDVCGFDYTRCGGSGSAIGYAAENESDGIIYCDLGTWAEENLTALTLKYSSDNSTWNEIVMEKVIDNIWKAEVSQNNPTGWTVQFVASSQSSSLASIGTNIPEGKNCFRITEYNSSSNVYDGAWYQYPCTSHDYKDGICTNCDAYQPATDSNSDGVYEIGNAGQLFWFAQQVNNGNNTINAVLTADIDLENRSWTPMGTHDDTNSAKNSHFKGTFDGNYHIVKNLSVTVEDNCEAGFFGRAEGATIQNFGIVNAHVEGKGGYRVGVIGGELHKCAVTNVFSAGEITLITDNAQKGGIAGECHSSTLNGCFTTYSNLAAAANVTVTNCYYLAEEANSASAGMNMSANEFTSGEVTWLLNGESAEGIWKQTLDTDTYPSFTGDTVYCGYSNGCFEDAKFYTNNPEEVTERADHTFDNGICTVCGAYEPAADSDADGYYEIYNVGNLFWFAQQVNNSETTISAILMNDIAINSQVLDADGNLISDTSGLRQWTPIGHYNSDTDNLGFAGTFDGNGKTIRGLYHYGDSARYAGMFGYSAGTIRDLTIADAYIHTTHSNGRAGSVAGLNEGTVSNCQNFGFVGGVNQVGGIVGRINAGSVENCTNYGRVSGTANYVGGICGYEAGGAIQDCSNSGTVSGNQYVGGICGYEAGGAIQDCSNSGTVSGTADSVGGIAGDVSGGTIQDCSNSGTISGNQYVGGICGYEDGGAIQDCSNSGTVSGNQYVGGIAGNVSGATINNCCNTGPVKASGKYVGGIAGWIQRTSTISNCFSSGTVAGTSSVGGIVGHIVNNSGANVTISDCYYDINVYIGDAVGAKGSKGTVTITNVEGKTTEAFASGEVTWLLNGESAEGIWKQTIGTDTYPGFTGGTVYHSSCGSGVPYSNDAEETKEHNIGEDFRCVNILLSGGICNAYESASQNADGYYEIYNASQLYWFAEQVNGGQKSINAILMNDIDLTNHTWITICSTGIYNTTTTYDDPGYQGIFNGNGHVIKNFTVQGISDTNCTVGLFGTLSGTVKNLGVDNMTFDLNGATDVRAAGIAGQMLDGSLIEDCYVVNSTLAPNGYIVGGIAACNYAGTIKDCFTKNVTIQANTRCGNLVSDTRGDINATDRPGTVTNCWTDADRVVGTQNVAFYITDCHANAEEAIASGEIAYALGDGWGQTIGTDGYPVFGGATVYQVANTGCPAREYAYSNVNEAVVIPHEYTNGFCACGEYEEAVQNADGYYVIDNAGKLFWFAELVNAGNGGANAKLIGNIDLENRSWEPIANYSGTFDGGNYSITNLNVNATASGTGLFGSVSGTVKNLVVSGSVTVSANDVMGVGVIGVLQNGGVAQGITSQVNITVNSGITGTCYIGGVVGTLWGTVTECAYYGNISLGDAAVDQTGGIVAYVEYNATAPAITNCGFYGSITATNTANFIGGILGYSRNSKLTLEHCLSVGDLPDSGNAVTAFGVINAAPASISGLYYLEGSAPNGTANSGNYSYTPADGIVTAVTSDQLNSGEVAWLLNGSTDQGDLVWYQNIGMDAYPKFVGCVVNYNTESDTYHNGNTVSVSISWTAMSFTYTASEWDPETHTYTGSWTADYGAAQITVKNVGAANVPVHFTFDGTMGEVTGGFDVEKAALAPGRAVTTILTVSGDPQKSGFVDEQIGTATVSLGGSGWAAGDKVTFYAKDGNAYPSTVAEVTDAKMVLVSDYVGIHWNWQFGKGADETFSYFQSTYLDPVGARFPVAWTAEYYNFVVPYIKNNHSLNILVYSRGTKCMATWYVTSSQVSVNFSFFSLGHVAFFYIWDVEFAE